MNHDKIRTAIAKLSLCEEGQAAVTTILGELGYQAPPDKDGVYVRRAALRSSQAEVVEGMVLRVSGRWSDLNSPNMETMRLDGEGRVRFGLSGFSMAEDHDLTFYAPTLGEACRRLVGTNWKP